MRLSGDMMMSVDEKVNEDRKHFDSLSADLKKIANQYLKEGYSITKSLEETEKFKNLNNEEKTIANHYLQKGVKPIYVLKKVDAFKQIQNLVNDDEIKIANRYLYLNLSYTFIMEEIKAFRDIQNLPEDLKIGANKDVFEGYTSIDTLHNIALEDLNEKMTKHPKDSTEYILLDVTIKKLEKYHNNLPKEYNTPTRALKHVFRYLPKEYMDIYFIYEKKYGYDNYEKALKEALTKREIDNLPEKIKVRAKDYIKHGIPPTYALKHALIQEEIDNLPLNQKQKAEEYIRKGLSSNSALDAIKIERKYEKQEKHPLS